MSTSMAQASGTLFSASPPRIRPRLIEGRSKRSDDSRANGSDSIPRKTSIALSTAFVATQVWSRARAAKHLDPHRQDALGLHADVEVGGFAGHGEVAGVAALHELVGGAVLLLRLLVGHADEVDAHAVLAGEVAQRAHHSGQATLHVIGAAPEEPVAGHARAELPGAARARRRGARGRQPSVRFLRSTVAAISGRPPWSVPTTSTSWASSQALMKPAALCMPSRLDVS